jgi:hypothetical protein
MRLWLYIKYQWKYLFWYETFYSLQNLKNKNIFILECSKQFLKRNIRIVGGIAAIPNSWPAQVFIVQNVKGIIYPETGAQNYVSKYFCGGTLINEQTVVTAGHCVQSKFYSDNYFVYNFTDNYPTLESSYDIYLGVHNLAGFNENNPNMRKYSVRKIIRV